MAGKTNSELALDFFNRLTGENRISIDIKILSSAQKARFLSWCSERNIDILSMDHLLNYNAEMSQKKDRPTLGTFESPSAQAGIGIDIQFKTELFRDSVLDIKSDASLLKVFTQREMAYAESRNDPLETLTGIFAAKEAILKSSNPNSINLLSEIDIDYTVDGAPIVQGYQLSISHCNGIAVAIAFRQNPGESRSAVVNSNTHGLENKINNDAFHEIISAVNQKIKIYLAVSVFLSVTLCAFIFSLLIIKF